VSERDRSHDRLGELCRDFLRRVPVDGAAVAVMNRAGHRGVGYASNPTARALEDLGFTLGESPAITAFVERRTVLVGDLLDGQSARWPAFAEAAGATGCRAVFGFPLQVGAIPVGALSLHAGRPLTLAQDELAVVEAATGEAAQLVVELLEDSVGPAATPGVAGPEFLRAPVYQASGMIMVQLGLSIDAAMARLRAYAYAHDVPINEVARDVVTRQLRFEPDTE
jgi:hypothetical protein